MLTTARYWVLMRNSLIISGLTVLLTLITARTGLAREEAYALCSLVADVRVTQVVNGAKGIHVMLDKRYLAPRA